MRNDNVSDAQLWSFRGDKFFARKINAFSSQRRLLVSCEPQRASEGGDNDGSKRSNSENSPEHLK
jgi:hypothetical protein